MDGGRILRNSQIIILGVCIAVATIVASLILSQASLRVMQMTRQVITVTGSASREITSDSAAWQVNVMVRDADLGLAYKQLSQHTARLRQYLLAKGVTDKELVVPQVNTERLYKKDEHGQDTPELLAYRLTQPVEVSSEDVDKLTRLSRGVTELINEEIEVSSGAPQYFYRGLDALKLEMLAQAAENAKQRADNMVKAAGNRIGLMRSAKMGVFQITPVHSTEVSDYGVNDTGSVRKKVTAVVNASFAIE
jgi:hypothetical protein